MVTNTTGHKLPSAYPSRRAWLRFVRRPIVDGRRLFASGDLRPDGSIVGNDNDRDPLAFEPHQLVIDAPEQVQIYESIMVDAGGRVTTGLLSGVRYAKDNRLLPRGLDKAAAAGTDYAVPSAKPATIRTFRAAATAWSTAPCYPADAAGPFRVDVELQYRPISFRWAHNLDGYRTASEPSRFVGYYAAMSSGSATVLARATAAIDRPGR